MITKLLITLLTLWFLPLTVVALDTTAIERAIGANGVLNKQENVFKVAIPLQKLAVNINGVDMAVPMGLNSWVAFKTQGKKTLMTANLLLLENQVNPLMSLALEQDLSVIGLTNYFLWENPRLMMMSLRAKGDETQLAAAMAKIIKQMKKNEMVNKLPRTNIDPTYTVLNTEKINSILAAQGAMQQGVYRVVFDKNLLFKTKKKNKLPMAMGFETWLGFAGTDQRAVMSGDMVVRNTELQNVLKALRQADINVTSIQGLQDSLPITIIHIWGTGSAMSLANGFMSVIPKQS